MEKIKTCDTCKFAIEQGGDFVPYGSTTTQLPITYECDCPNIPEDIFCSDEAMSKLMDSGDCKYWDIIKSCDTCRFINLKCIDCNNNLFCWEQWKSGEKQLIQGRQSNGQI